MSVKAIQSLHIYIDNKYNGVKQTVNTWLSEITESQVKSATAAPQLPAANEATTQQAQNYTSTTTLNSLLNKSDQQTVVFASIPANDVFIAPILGFSFRPQATNFSLGNDSLNADTLLSPINYGQFNTKELEKNPAYNFIQFSGDLFQPLSTISLTTVEPKLTPQQIDEIQANATFQQYRAALRAYVAAQSIGLSNLYQIMAKRIPQPGLGSSVGLVGKNNLPIADASQLQVEQYLATRRSEDPNWHRQIATASPIALQRESLLVLVDIQRQLFEMQQQNERLLATISMMQMQQNSQNAKLNFIQMEQKIDELIKSKQGVSATTEMPSSSLGLPK